MTAAVSEHAPGDGARRHAPTLLLLALVALAARLVNLDSGLWFDEIWLLVEFLRQPLGELFTTFESDNVHPLYAIGAWLSVHAFGEAPWALRLPAVLFGVGGVLLVYLYAVRSFDRRTAVFAALLIAFSSHHIAFSQNARGYTGLLFFTLLSCYAFEEALRTGRRRAWVLQGVALALATWIHLTGVFVAFAQVLVWGLARVAPRDTESGPAGRASFAPLFGVALGGLVALGVHAPILPEMFAFFTQPKDDFGATQSEWRTPLWMLREIARSLGQGEPLGFALMGVGGVVFLIGWWAVWKRSRELALFAILPGLVGQGTMWLLGRNLWPRFFFSLAGFLVIVGVVGVVTSVRRVLRERAGERAATAVLVLSVVGAAMLCRRVWTLPKQDFVAAQRFLEAERAPGERVFSAGLAMYPLADYLSTDYVVTEDVALLDDLSDEAWIVVSGGTFTRAYYPDVWQRIVERGREVRRFSSQNADLDIVVLKLRP